MLVFYGDTNVSTAHVLPARMPRNKPLYFIKVKDGRVNTESIDQELLVSDVTSAPLEHLELIMREVYLPLLSNANNQEGWGEVSSKEIMDRLHSFLAQVSITVGQTQGQTCLPLPSVDTDINGINTKDRIHVLEGAVITWTKQIKNVLKQDPEMLLKQGMNPTPDIEVEFWKSKATNLNSIFEQLQSRRIRRVLKFLDVSKSTYCNPFAKLCKEVYTARLEANDNVRYLRALEPWFDKLEAVRDFPELVGLFRPIMHVLLLIWKNSKYFNTPARLVVLMREMCNSIINKACNYVSGQMIFDLIADESAGEAVSKLKTTLKVCGLFKSTYFDYKTKANNECPNNPWRIQNNALFMRLDSFLERCHDILDLTQTIVQFSMLAKIEIGGTKGKTLTNSVSQIYLDFDTAVETFKNVPYDIMDVGVKQFDDDFYEFRCRIKELERRLGSVLTQGFDDCATIYGRFKLLDSFEGLLERPIIQDELEKKHVALVQAYGADLKRVQEQFLLARDAPPISWNLPPIAGSLTWCRGLKERIQEPMAKLRMLNDSIMDRDEAREVVKVYSTIMVSLDDYEHQKIQEWGSNVEQSSQAKLRLPLLARQSPTTPNGTGLLRVNFDPALVRLLREVKYFLLLKLDVPSSALDIYRKAETYRTQTGNLDLIVNMYNRMMTELLPVEAPLMESHLKKIDQGLRVGIQTMSWKSSSINDFISKVQGTVKTAHDVLFNLKSNLRNIQQTLDKWSVEPLMDRKMKPVAPDEFAQAHKALLTGRYAEIKEGGQRIEKTLKASHAILKVSKGHPDWRSYVDFVSCVVVHGLSKVVVRSLSYLSDQLNPVIIAKLDKNPVLVIDLNLFDSRVMFNPDIYETSNRTGVRDIVANWINSFYHAATLFRRLDTPEGRYAKDMVDDEHVRMLLARIHVDLANTEEQLLEFREQYTAYAYLWETDLNVMFAEFVAASYNKLSDNENAMSVPDLTKFDAEIAKYRQVQQEVNELRTPTDIGWLRVNSEPIKQALATCVTKWTFMFTEHLNDYVVNTLKELQEFISRVDEGLEEEVVAGPDKAPLKRCMAHIRDVRKSMETRQEMFHPLRDTVALLKTHGISMEGQRVGDMGVLEYLDAAPLKWEATINKTFKKKEEIYSLQTAEMDNIKEQVERFFLSMRAFRAKFKEQAPFSFAGPIDAAYAQLDDFESQLAAMEASAQELNALEDLFELPVSKYQETTDTRRELCLLKTVWDMKACVEHTFEEWQLVLWSDIDTDDLESRNKKLMMQIKRLGDQNQVVKVWRVYKDLDAMVRSMQTTLPLVHELHSPAMRDRHWKSLAHVCHAKPIDPRDAKFCLQDLLNLKLHLHVEHVEDVVETATKELKIEKKLQGIEETWAGLALEYVPHKDSDVRVIKASDEVVESLEAHQMELQTMIGMGKFVDYFRDRVTSWQRDLGNVESVLKEWLSVTKVWASLESIFLGSADIRAQLPDDTKRFEGIDQEFKDLMKVAVDVPNVVNACIADGRQELLRSMTKNLELCQKSLNEYLDMKKKIFPRFYFVSNVALLDILSNGNNPPKIMPYVGDCYDSIKRLTFQPATEEGAVPNVATQMIAKDGEVVDFYKPFEITGAVENWLNELTQWQQQTLAHILEQAVDTAVNWDVEKPRHVWLNDYPAQVVLVGTQIFWSDECRMALEDLESGAEDAVKRYLSLCNDRLQALIQLVLGQLPRALRTKIISLITMDVHGRDTVQKLITQRADGPMSFVWQQQLRFEWVPESRDVLISITDFKSTYSYEWVGNSGRLVITPLTDRCYITLTMALRLMLGGAPAGPAGTGKTETTKDLARALALPCYVFNCSDQMNYQTMADIFKGLSQTGSWGCFDEFNRIPIEVLSVVATQVKSVLDAIVKYSVPANREPEFQGLPAGTPPSVVGSFDLMGDTITLIPTVGFFITMNPGYAGRTELPENLKALFRSCAMIRPDLALICENMLLSEGFMRARPLSIKFVTLYQLSSELLSPQAHYDWGLRSVKSVLRVAGSLKRAEPHIDEEAILMRALRDFNTPKMPTVDLPIFLRLVQDLFPSHYQLPTKFSTAIRDGAVQACKNAKLQYDPGFIAKVVQLQELLDVRHSVMLIGPAGCGKTTIWKMLQGCHNLGKAKPTSISVIVNPKAVTSDELYGYMTLSKDWKDGVLSIIMRGMSKNYKELGYHEYQSNKWVVLDGDIDAVWIESMNTVMDDNKVLTLVSNERIPLSPAMRMMFEISSLDNATPATVSRAGMLYVNETDVGWRPFTESWLACREDETEKAHLPGLFDKYVEPLYDMVRREFKTVVPLRLINMVKTTCFLLEGLLADLVNTSHNPELIESLFLIALMWAFGGCLSHKSKDGPRRFHDRLESLSTTIKFPKGAVCFDYFFDVAAGEFVPWETKVPDYVPVPIGSGPGETTFGNLVVATVDTVRLTALLDQLARGRHPVMFAGTAGTGKTTLTQDYLRNLDEETLSCTINMNYFMDSAALQLQLEGAIDKRSGRTYGPPTGKTLVYYVDDVNLPYVETYGTQNALSLLRQLMDHGQMYDRADLDLCKLVVDVQFVATMNPTAGSFTINSRLQGHFATFSCTMPSATDLRNIYQAIFAGHTATFDGRVQKMVEKIVNTTVALHESVASKFLPSATKFVYNWNMRELRNVFQGLCLAQPEYYVSTLKVARLWVHECYRVFGDRLTNEGDITQFDTMLRDHSKLSFNDESFEQEELHARPLVYTSFVSQPGSEPVYLPVPTGEEGDAKLSKVLMEKLEEYNSSNNIMNLVLFKQAMQHVCRICRIIFNPSGNAMLVGVGGSGKQSLSRLAAFICGYDVVQLSVTSKFTVADLKESLKDMYKSAGVKGNGIVFLMTDSQIVDEKFLVYVNDMLSSGWISDLYARDELDSVFGSLRSEAKAAGIPDTPETMLEFFISRVRRNLHLVLCFSPVGQAFRVRARRFPGLINCTAIDWFHPWPGPALVSVAAKFLADVELGTPETKENVAYHMAEVHLTVTNMSEVFLRQERRYNYVTPKSFLELIAFYKHLLAEKRTIVGGLIERLATGLATLRKTEADVTELQADLRDTMVRVEEKKNATDNLLHQMGKQRQEAEVQQEKAEEEAKKAAAASAEAEKIQSQAEAELAEAKPAMDAAAEAVKCLNKASLTELKNFSKPPSGVDKVTACCLMMLEGEYKNHKWDRAKKMMAKVDHFLQKLLAFDARTDMTDDLVKKLTPFVQQDGFTYQAMLSKSMAAANLCAWVTNTYAYNRIYVRVKPLMDRLEAAKGRKQAADEALATVMAEVAEVEARLKQLQQTLLEATNEKIAVEREAQACTDRLGLAERLVNGLASEKERWGKEIERLKENEVTLVGDVLLASAFVSYIGAFDHRFRADLWENVWTNDLQLKEIPLSEGVDPLAMLTDNSRTAQMMSEGLPADRISIENGALINSSKRWPLIIDPQLQGIKWLRKKEAENDLQIIQLTQKNWLHAIVTGISQGGTIIIENLGEDVDATLDPVLSRAVYRKGRSMFIKVGDDEVEYDPNFQLYLQTKLSNPHYKPEIQAQCTMVNFIATEKGLQDQLLAKAVNVEKRELEEEKQKLQDAFNRFVRRWSIWWRPVCGVWGVVWCGVVWRVVVVCGVWCVVCGVCDAPGCVGWWHHHSSPHSRAVVFTTGSKFSLWSWRTSCWSASRTRRRIFCRMCRSLRGLRRPRRPPRRSMLL